MGHVVSEVFSRDGHRILCGDNLAVMPELPAASIDAIVTDPPYGLGFMGREWDKALPDPATWVELYRVAKPGAHLVACGSPRLYHRPACALEDAGGVLRDCLMWLYGSGFPKSFDVSKAIDKAAGAERPVVGFSQQQQRTPGVGTSAYGDYAGQPGDVTGPATEAALLWDGWGTALKPAWEPILLARKPLGGTVAANVLEHGTGAINIDGCRVGSERRFNEPAGNDGSTPASVAPVNVSNYRGAETAGRWPANVVLGCACPDGGHDAGCAVAMLDAQSGESRGVSGGLGGWQTGGYVGGTPGRQIPRVGYDGIGGASRFFYTAKASRSEREAGLSGKAGERRNLHPTVKPIALMRWLCRLITPPGGLVLDPFAGSGSTALAAHAEGFRSLSIELDAGHAGVAAARLHGATEQQTFAFEAPA